MSSSVDGEETCVLKNFDEIVRSQFRIREEWIRYVRGERLYGIVDGWSSVPCLDNSWTV